MALGVVQVTTTLGVRVMYRRFFGLLSVVLAVLMTILLSSCAAISMSSEEFSRAIRGVSGTVSTYNESSRLIDRVSGTSFRFSRDQTFDSKSRDGESNKDSSVLLISLGDNHISHVGSTLIFAQNGIVDISDSLPNEVRFSNTEPGTPWLNDIRYRYGNLWQGKARTIMVRSQDGTPLAVFAGDHVETFSTDIPKSTAFRIDGRYLLIYRADYTVYDTELLG